MVTIESKPVGSGHPAASHYFAASNLKIRSLLVALNANRVRKEINNV
jgi:hypothetical protein